MNRGILAAQIVLLAGIAALGAAETGDFDGDGRLSIADVVRRVEGLTLVDGSLDGLESYPCRSGVLPNELREKYTDAGLTYLESLRRNVPDSLPHWMQNVFGSREPGSQPPLATDPRVTVLVDDVVVPGGVVDQMDLTLHLVTRARLKAFSLLLDNRDGILRVPFVMDPEGFDGRPWAWIFPPDMGANRFPAGDISVSAPHAAFLITNGRYVIEHGLIDTESREGIEPGDYRIVVSVRLPRGTAAGQYQIRVLEASEIVFDDGSVATPQSGPAAVLTVRETLTAGWDEGIPPLDFDPLTKGIVGKTEFRVANVDGVAANDGFPVTTTRPGENVKLRVQVRMEVPLNRISCGLEWRSEHLRCAQPLAEGVRNLFTDPADGSLYPFPISRGTLEAACGTRLLWPPHHYFLYFLVGDAISSPRVLAKYNDRPLEHYKPLNEWRDLTEVELHVDGCAIPGEELALTFERFSVTDGNSRTGVAFGPYSNRFYCAQGALLANWIYEIEYHDGFILVGDGVQRCPEELPPDPGLRVVLGDVVGSPGERVEIPILASAVHPAPEFRLALESDPPEATVVEAELTMTGPHGGPAVAVAVGRGGQAIPKDCVDPLDNSTCTYGVPAGFGLGGDSSVDPKFTDLGIIVALDSKPGVPLPAYPGTTLAEIGRLRIEIPPDFTGPEIRLVNAVVPVDFGPFPDLLHETGALFEDHFYPALEVSGGRITIAKAGKDVIRGDANLDRAVDVSDAIAVLGYLFLGVGVLACEDTADADDNGEIEITDAIILLGALFLGNGAIPAPFPNCGADPNPDGLGCVEANCE